jgi:hypothetical protein
MELPANETSRDHGTSPVAEKLSLGDVLKGHDFSRADKPHKINGL